MHETDEHDDTRRPAVLHLEPRKDESNAAALARTAIAPELGATLALRSMHKKAGGVYDDVELGALMGAMMKATHDEAATGTDRLMSQAIVLDKLFTHLTAVAMRQEYVSGIAPALTLAMRAQAQCRATLQAVSDIRHPRQYVGTQHVGEQYNARGHQQINRARQAEPATPTAGAAHGSARANPPTELSKDRSHELHPNGGTPSGIEGAGATHETVGALDRAAHG